MSMHYRPDPIKYQKRYIAKNSFYSLVPYWMLHVSKLDSRESSASYGFIGILEYNDFSNITVKGKEYKVHATFQHITTSYYTGVSMNEHFVYRMSKL